jgi:hypothetical protein
MGSHWAGSGTPPSRSKDFYTPLLVVLAQCGNSYIVRHAPSLQSLNRGPARAVFADAVHHGCRDPCVPTSVDIPGVPRFAYFRFDIIARSAAARGSPKLDQHQTAHNVAVRADVRHSSLRPRRHIYRQISSSAPPCCHDHPLSGARGRDARVPSHRQRCFQARASYLVTALGGLRVDGLGPPVPPTLMTVCLRELPRTFLPRCRAPRSASTGGV